MIVDKKKKKKEKEKKKKKKRTCRTVDLTIPADLSVKSKESEKRDKYQDLARELKKKTMKQEGDGDTNCNRWTRNNPQRIDKRTRRLRNLKTRWEHPEYIIIRIGQNIEKSTGDLRRFAVVI